MGQRRVSRQPAINATHDSTTTRNATLATAAEEPLSGFGVCMAMGEPEPERSASPSVRAQGDTAIRMRVPPHAECAECKPTRGEHPQRHQAQRAATDGEQPDWKEAQAQDPNRDHPQRDHAGGLLTDGDHATRPLADADPAPRLVVWRDQLAPAQQPRVPRLRVQNAETSQKDDGAATADQDSGHDHELKWEPFTSAGQPSSQRRQGGVFASGDSLLCLSHHRGCALNARDGAATVREATVREEVAVRSVSPRIRADRVTSCVGVPAKAYAAEREPSSAYRPQGDKTHRDSACGKDPKRDRTHAEHPHREHTYCDHASGLLTHGDQADGPRANADPTPRVLALRQQRPTPHAAVIGDEQRRNDGHRERGDYDENTVSETKPIPIGFQPLRHRRKAAVAKSRNRHVACPRPSVPPVALARFAPPSHPSQRGPVYRTDFAASPSMCRCSFWCH